MAYGFAKQSNGHIKLYSEVGSGTTVQLYLPRTLQKLDAEKPFEAEAIAGGDETILIAEDDPQVQATVVATLEELGYRVLRANDASAALAIVESGARVDLLFTDVVMPVPLRSPELVKMAKALLPDIAVLYTSGYTQNAIVHGGRLDPGVELLSKPYRQEDLARRMRKLLGPPRSAPIAELAVAPKAPEVPVAAKPGVNRVLVVEDDPVLLDLTTELLQFLGCQVLGIGSAEMALEMLDHGGESFDILLTDLGLPCVSGAEFTRGGATFYNENCSDVRRRRRASRSGLDAQFRPTSMVSNQTI